MEDDYVDAHADHGNRLEKIEDLLNTMKLTKQITKRQSQMLTKSFGVHENETKGGDDSFINKSMVKEDPDEDEDDTPTHSKK